MCLRHIGKYVFYIHIFISKVILLTCNTWLESVWACVRLGEGTLVYGGLFFFSSNCSFVGASCRAQLNHCIFSGLISAMMPNPMRLKHYCDAKIFWSKFSHFFEMVSLEEALASFLNENYV